VQQQKQVFVIKKTNEPSRNQWAIFSAIKTHKKFCL